MKIILQPRGIIPGLLLIFLVLIFPINLKSALPAAEKPQEKLLIEVLDEISRDHQVYFTYDADIIKGIVVDYVKREGESVGSILSRVLVEVNMDFKIFEDRFVILYRKDEAGLRSLEKMISHMEEIVKDRKELFASRRNSPIARLRIDDWAEINRKRLVLNITGRVIDSNGEPLIGVNILVKGTNTGTTTDIDGRFSLTDINDQAILVLSYIGYQGQQVAVNGQTSLTIIMQEDIQTLDEVIVVGYGVQKKSDLTGSVIRVKAEDFKRQSSTQITDLLVGTVAGFYANQSTSAAGGSTMEIRGKTSLAAGTNPLIVLDGVIFSGSLRDINPNDVETIDILKDASSSAIFGAKAASGVIIITTKKGVEGKPTINFSSKLGITETAADYKPLGPEEYLKFRGDYLRTQSYYTQPEYYYTHPDHLPDHIPLEEWKNYSSNPNADNELEYLQRHRLQNIEIQQYLDNNPTDWYDLVVVPGIRQDYDLSVSGGSERLSYYWSLGYVDNEGIIKGDKFSAIRSRINLDFSVNQWLSVGINSHYSLRDESSTPGSLNRTYRVSPWGSPINDDGSIRLLPQELFTAEHPLMEYYGTDRYRKINSVFANLYSNVKLPFGINFKTSFQPRTSATKDYNFYGEQHTLGYATHLDGYGTRHESSVVEWQIDNILTWRKEFDHQEIDLTFLYNVEKFRSWSTDINSETFSPNQNLGFHALQFGINPQISNNDQISTGDALMARFNYSLLKKYLLTASLRRDGYSAFGTENPRSLFPAVAFAWHLSQEDFFRSNLISRMKLRASWGKNGNRDIGRYAALANIGSRQYYDGSIIHVAVHNSTLSNSRLRWERTEAYNIGIEIGLFDNRFDANLDLYTMSTVDLLMNRTLPRLTGFTSITENLGELKNKGIEVSMNSINYNSNNFQWRTNFVFSLNRNKITKLFGDVGEYTLLGEQRYGELPDFSNHWFPGQSVDVVWNYDITGVWQNHEAEEAEKFGLRVGDYKASELIDDSKYVDIDDKQFIGHTTPRYRIGLRNDFDIAYGISASFFVRADLGHIGSFSPPVFQGSSEMDRFSMSGKPYQYWMPENPNDEYPRLDANVTRGAYGGGLNVYKSMSFVRIQDLSISYTLPQPLINRYYIQNMMIYCSIRNLISIDNWPGFDPESRLSPMPRNYTIGLELSL